MVVDIDPRVRAKVGIVIAEVGEAAFRRGVSEMTGYDTETLSIDDVVCVYVFARQRRLHPPSAGQRAVALYPTLAPRSVDDPCLDLAGRRRSPFPLTI